MSNIEFLYHYTSRNGLDGIMSNSSFWATRSIFSNDIQDSKYIKSILSQVLKLYDNKKYKDFKKSLYYTFNYAENECITPSNCKNEIFEKAFIISFSHKKDSRFFWEAYTQNDGFNLMFNKKKLINHFNLYKPNIYFNRFMHRNVIYNEKEQKRIIIKILENALKYYKYCGKDSIKKDKIIKNLVKKFIFEAPFFKDSFWEEEKEYRFAFFRKYHDKNLVDINFNHKPKYEGLDSKQTYINLPFDTNLIQKIIIGPCSIIDINKFLSSYCFFNNNIFQKSKGYGFVRKFIV
ncbi:hypothetical protein SH2C18_45920 [Clostridium sediminicola]|uniref:DUF2971 domain-containing protein n=1 Tax=Clostridium sediminicola TaxID=3114879 RepID=UPI0031F23005